ncbi:MAG TPA: PepSY domain-containing protein [Gemmatimonadales bacterium]|nr:PepSY domain-containing protein [Gemmatimonadales bacterium]
MRVINKIALIAGLSLVAGTATLSAQNPMRQVPDSLVAKAKVSEDSARGIALKRVPGSVEGVKLHSTSGKLDWVFGIKPNGKSGVEKVTINAMTGHIVSVSAASSSKKHSATQR